jgi:hypothetical protein
MNRWFTYINNGTHEIHINMELIRCVVFNGQGVVYVDEHYIDGNNTERFRMEFIQYNNWRKNQGL